MTLDRRRLLEAIGVMGSQAGAKDSEILLALTHAGFTNSEADALIAFVPLAFSRPIMEELGVAHFSESVSAKNKSGQWIQIPLASQTVYVAALTVAREHRRSGLIDRDVFKTLALRCSQLDAVSNALNAGADVRGATVATALIALHAEDLIPASWFRRLKRAIVG
jgi:hypothetical protein